MAATLHNEEEKDKRIKEVCLYTIENNSSTRETALYFTNNKYKITNVTVAKYIKEALIKYPSLGIKAYDVINSKKNRRDKIRVLMEAREVLNGKTIKELSEESNTNYFTIYRDLTVELPKLDDALFKAIEKRLTDNKMSNLKNVCKK